MQVAKPIQSNPTVSPWEPSLHELVRYARNVEVKAENDKKKFQPLIGEEPGFLTTFCAFAMARRPVTVRAFSGTGKTVMADAVWELLPEKSKIVVDMGSKVAIYYIADRINERTFVYFPEEQNASDNDEIVKIKKKWGEGKDAEREVTGGLLENGTRGTTSNTLKWHPDLSTVAIGNKVGEQVFDEEQERRRVIVSTDPSSKQTRNVLKAQARVWSRGATHVRDFSALELMRLKTHVAECIGAYDSVKEVRFFGAEAFASGIPDTFTASRSAFPLLMHVAKGVGLFYHKSEQIEEGVLTLSPARFAECLEFYGPTFFSNCMKLPAMGRPVLEAFPTLKTAGAGQVHIDSMLTEQQIMETLVRSGVTIERKKVKTIIERLVDGGFLELNKDMEAARWHRTKLADVSHAVNWPEMLEQTRKVAEDELGDSAAEWVKKHSNGSSVTYTSPITGQTVTTGASK